MWGLAIFGAMAMAGLFFMLAVVVLIVKIAISLIVLPFRLVFWLPMLLVKVVLGVVGAVLLGTGLAVGGVLLAIGIIVAVLVPLLPFAIVAGLIWLVYRATRPQVAIARS
ncbi:MAG TPA: hypothetical protein VFV98_03150 [Vicinamibacterales bacterium]|nr:hypothetical protein [Vicinamibacterales bacterium]